ncbi:hypothetical protein ACX6XY_19250 [Streptomyces sp. O3]
MLRPARVLPSLVRPELRAARTLPLLCGAVCAVVVAAVPLVSSTRPGVEAAAVLLRVSAVFGVIGLAFLFDDPAARSTTVAPVTCRARRAIRLAAGFLVLTGGWGVAASLTRTAMSDRQSLPIAALAQETSTLALLTVLLALLGLRVTGGQSGSTLAAPGLAVLLAVLLALPQDAALFVSPTDAGWHDAVARWRFLGIGAGVGCCLLLMRTQSAKPVLRRARNAAPKAPDTRPHHRARA